MDNKEFKVLNSNTPIFKKPEKMQKILAEEAEHGWDLEEKFDNYKIRLSRDKGARNNNSSQTDPYRTETGINSTLYLTGAAVVTVFVIYAIIQAAAMSV